MTPDLSASIANLIMDEYSNVAEIDTIDPNRLHNIDVLDYISAMEHIIHVVQASHYDKNLMETIIEIDPMFDTQYNYSNKTNCGDIIKILDHVFNHLNANEKQTYVKIQQLTKHPLFNHRINPPLQIK